MRYVVTVRECTANEIVVDAPNPTTAREVGLQAFHNGFDVDYAVDVWVETVTVEEENNEQTVGEEEVRRQSRPDDMT